MNTKYRIFCTQQANFKVKFLRIKYVSLNIHLVGYNLDYNKNKEVQRHTAGV